MSFYGPLFRSYATGIARLGKHKGKPYVILNRVSFSTTTAKHCGLVRSAIPDGVPCFSFAEDRGARLEVSPSALFKFEMDRAAESLAYAERPRVNRAKAEGEAARFMENANSVAAFFGLKSRANTLALQRLASSKAALERREERGRVKREKAEQAEALADFEAWKGGADVHRSFSMFPVAFRVEGKELVSTMGARVPVSAARAALRFVKSRKGQEWRENGETCPVGSYRVNSITPSGLVAGCHRISWDEVERVESLLTKKA